MYFDTHAHYDDEYFDEDREVLLASLKENNISLVLNPGINEASCLKAVEFADKYDYFYAAIGWHPSDVLDFTEKSEQLLYKLAKHPKVKAIGEIGLDYYWTTDTMDVQKKVFRRQLEIAQELNLPVIIHDREAHGDCLDILRAHKDGLSGIVHCFSGSYEMARSCIDLGFVIAFGGALTFKNAVNQRDIASRLPLECIVLETDCPYMTPEPFRGKRNDPSLIRYTCEQLAQLHHMQPEEIAHITMENGKRILDMHI